MDDGLVQSDKIGQGTFFWSLPSKSINDWQTLNAKLETQITDAKAEIERLKSGIEEQKTKRQGEGTDW